MTITNLITTPGVGTVRTADLRRILCSPQGLMLKPGGIVIDGANARDPLNTGYVTTLRAGTLMGKITASGKWAPSIVGRSTVAYVDNDLTITVSLATATELIRRLGGTTGSLKLSGPPGASGVVAATAVTATNITLNGAASTITTADLNLAKVTDSLIQVVDGSETIRGILGNEEGLRMTDIDGNNLDVVCDQLIVGGMIDTSQIINLPADASTVAWIKAALRAVGYGFYFDDDA